MPRSMHAYMRICSQCVGICKVHLHFVHDLQMRQQIKEETGAADFLSSSPASLERRDTRRLSSDGTIRRRRRRNSAPDIQPKTSSSRQSASQNHLLFGDIYGDRVSSSLPTSNSTLIASAPVSGPVTPEQQSRGPIISPSSQSMSRDKLQEAFDHRTEVITHPESHMSIQRLKIYVIKK